MAANESTLQTTTGIWSFTRCGGLAGLLGVALFVVGIVLSMGAPTVNDSVAEARTWWADNGQRWLWSSVVIGLGVILFLVPYLVALRGYLGRVGSGALSGIGVLAVVFWLLLGASASSFNGVLALGIDQIDSDATVRALQWGDFAGFSSNSLALAPFFGAIAAAFWKSKAWLAWLSLVLGIASLLGTFSIVTADPEHPLAVLGLISTAGFGVVTIVLSASMLMDESGA